MKKLILLLTLITAFSTLTLADTDSNSVSSEAGISAPSAGNDPMGMMAAFMGTSSDADSSGEIGGGETSVSAPAGNPSVVVVPTITTTITNSNVTTSTPYSYK